jgi:hypothetical protein
MTEQLFLPGKVCIQLRNWCVTILPVLLASASVFSQTDQFGAQDRIYLDKVEVTRGKQISVGVYMSNDEPIASVSVPLTYNPQYLSLSSVSFEGSRGAHIATKMVAPEQVNSASGHFLTGIVSITEEPITAGDGLLFTAVFTVSPSAPVGTEIIVDSLFYPPGGELLLVEATSSTLIRPIFESGQITVAAANQPPVIQAASSVYILEGDSLKLPVVAIDINNDPVQLTCSRSLPGAAFTQANGHGQFRWSPDFLGAKSADGSPFTIQFWATDGIRATTRDVQVHVINKNRKPTISLIDSVAVDAGLPILVDITYGDPDYDTTTLTVVSAPAQSELGYSSAFPINGLRQATFEWNTAFADSGKKVVQIIATDSHGAADTSELLLHVLPVAVYNFSVVDTNVNPGSSVDVPIALENLAPMSSFSLLLHIDPTVLTLHSVQRTNTRSANFTNFSSTVNYGGVIGDVLVQGTAGTQPLASGNGSLFKLRVVAASNVNYSGLNIPVGFTPSMLNMVKDSASATVPNDQLDYQNGSVFINSLGDVLLGDINLNQIPYDIGDAIYFTQFFINPFAYPLNPLQLANSDINQDDLVPTIADMVSLIRVISGDLLPPGDNTGGLMQASVQFIMNPNGTQTIQYSSNVPLGAVLLKGTAATNITPEGISIPTAMTVDVGTENNEDRILVYSLEGDTLQQGTHALLTLPAGTHFSASYVEFSSADGRIVEVALNGGVLKEALPTAFALQQNYPNPFNPETNIAFDMATPGRVRLAVYNLLGQQLRKLIDQEYPVGHHSVIWDSRDDAGALVSSGVYFYRLETQGESFTKKMTLVK